MTIALGIACLVLFLGAVGMTTKMKTLEARAVEAEGREAKAIFESARVQDRMNDLLVPLGWVWGAMKDQDAAPHGAARLRLYLVAAYTEVQKGLLLDDLEMAEALERAALVDPPRRLPRYPQVPAFLASPEDVAGVPAALQGPLSDEATHPLIEEGRTVGRSHDGFDPAQGLRSYVCIEGHRTTTREADARDLSGEPCPVEVDGVPCRKVLR